MMDDPHPDASRHPAATTLAEHAAGTLSGAEVETVREHLAGCPHCARIVLDLTAPEREPGTPEAGSSDPEMAAAWRSHVVRRSERPVHPAAGREVPDRRRWTSLAAALLGGILVGAGLVGLLPTSDPSSPGPMSPIVGPPGVELVPQGSLRDPDAIHRLALPPGTEVFTLTLIFVSPPPSRQVDVEILDREGRTVWRGEGQIPEIFATGLGGEPAVEPAGHLTLVLPAAGWSPGDYRVRLRASEGPSTDVEEYRFRLERSDPPLDPPEPIPASGPRDGSAQEGGLVVEEATAGWAGALAGLVPGDRLLSWRPVGSRRSNPLETPLELVRVALAEAPRRAIELQVERSGAGSGPAGIVWIELPPGPWGLGVRPRLPRALRPRYLEARRLLAGGQWRRGRELGAELAVALERSGAPLEAAWLLSRLGWALSGARREAEAAELFRQAVELAGLQPAELWPGSVPTAAVLAWDYGASLERQSRLAEAAEVYRSSLERWRSVTDVGSGLGSRSRWAEASVALATAHGYDRLARVQGLLGRLENAEASHRRSLQRRREHLPGSLAVATSESYVGLLNLQRGDLEAAERWLLRALAVYEKRAPQSPHTLELLHNLAVLALRRGELDTATTRLQRSLAGYRRLGRKSPELAVTWGMLGAVARQRGDLEDSDRCYRRALGLQQRLQPDSPALAATLLQLAELSLERRKAAEAAAWLRDAFSLGFALDAESPLRATALELRAALAATVGDGSSEMQDLRDALAIRRRATPGSAETAALLHRMGLAERRRGRARAALARFEQAIATLETQSAQLGGSYPVRARFRDLYADLYRDALDLLIERGQHEEAFVLLERFRARELLASLGRGERQRGASARLPIATSVALPERLPAGTLLLSYSVGRSRSHLFAVGPTQELGPPDLEAFELPIGENELQRQVRAFRSVLQPHRSTDSILAVGRPLSDRLLSPVLDRLAGARSLVVLPDGPLHDLAFAALPSPHSGAATRWLAEELPISIAPSLGTLLHLRQRSGVRSHPRDLVAFAGPEAVPRSASEGSGRSGLAGWYRLGRFLGRGRDRRLDLRREVEELARRFPGRSRIYRGAEATEKRAWAAMPGGDLLHFACHGHWDRGLPFESALILRAAGAGRTEVDNGLLRGREIVDRLRLDAELVTLAACNTGRGEALAGEGLVGLTRAFQLAGAHSVLASLWPVSDLSTRRLMEGFYRHLFSGARRDQALQRAQLELLHTAAPAGHRHPFHWASFQLFGDPG